MGAAAPPQVPSHNLEIVTLDLDPPSLCLALGGREVKAHVQGSLEIERAAPEATVQSPILGSLSSYLARRLVGAPKLSYSKLKSVRCDPNISAISCGTWLSVAGGSVCAGGPRLVGAMPEVHLPSSSPPIVTLLVFFLNSKNF